MTPAQLNDLSQEQFTAILGGIFEHSPWIAAASWSQRPFCDVEALHAAMCRVLADADDEAEDQRLAVLLPPAFDGFDLLLLGRVMFHSR